MTNFAIVKEYASAIRHEVLVGHMPPWHADPAYGKFVNDRGLTAEEKEKLIRWIDQGTPGGEGPDPLATVQPASSDWELGPPDYVINVPEQSIGATGHEPYHYVNVTLPFTNDVWIRAAVVRPGNRQVVHHVLVFANENPLLLGLDGFFAGYVPGTESMAFPAGTGKLLKKGGRLRFQLHYSRIGTPQKDRTQLGLYVYTNQPTSELLTRAAANVFFRIPPGAEDYEVSSEYQFDTAVRLFEMSPHMHYRGSRFRYEAHYPDGTMETLLSVPHYHFDWQTTYRLAEPKTLPAGTILRVFGAWDNSTRNPHNPDPTKAVTFGEQSDQEMLIGYFGVAALP
jgi:hypothetical protein